MSKTRIKVSRVYDPEVIKEVAEELWDVLNDDTPMGPEDFEPAIGDACRWYATYEDGELVSLWFVHQMNFITWQLHTHFRKKFWGSGKSDTHSAAALKKIWTNTQAKKLYAIIPEYAKQVLDLAKRSGFKQEGRIKKSIQKDGEIYDQIHIGVYR
jgi:RimJ/RimL family protein N-acetyltransferase